MSFPRRQALAVVAAALAALAPAAAARAATFAVSTTADGADAAPGNGVCASSGGACTVRAAIQEANALGGADAITIPGGRFVLGADAPPITRPVTVTGAGPRATILDGAGQHALLRVTGAAGSLTLSDVALTGGLDTYASALRVDTDADASLTRVAVRGNTTAGGGAARFGGAIGVLGNLALRDVTVSGNTVSTTDDDAWGGGVYVGAAATLNADTTTIAGNTAHAASTGPPATALGGGLASAGVTTLHHVTLARNTADAETGGTAHGGNLYRAGGTVTVADSLIGSGVPQACDAASGAPVAPLGPDLDADGTCGVPAGPLRGIDARLGALADTGGPLDAVPPLAGSPAIDAAATCPDGDADARGQRAPSGAACDLGAAEAGADLVTTIGASRTEVGPGGDVAYAVKVENRGFDAAPTVTAGLSPSSGADIAALVPSTGSCSGSAPITCTLGSLGAGASALVLVVLRAPASGALGVGAVALGGLPDPDPSTGAATAQTPVVTQPDTTAPIVTGARLAARPTARRDGRLTASLSEAATVTLGVEQLTPGRRRGGACRTNARRGRRCAIVRELRTLRVDAAAGPVRIGLPRRIRGVRLASGGYRLLLAATDAAGNRSRTVTITVAPRRAASSAARG